MFTYSYSLPTALVEGAGCVRSRSEVACVSVCYRFVVVWVSNYQFLAENCAGTLGLDIHEQITIFECN